ncbi:hypothetical protein BDR26DRAFT_905192 [Obelidium mucronatum]|nr:hypothetical protein BDR26DRAFT_905192 [Obelidium mucronatum]
MNANILSPNKYSSLENTKKTIQLRHGSSKLQAAEWVRSLIEAGVLPRINEMLQMDNDKPKFDLEKKVIKSKESLLREHAEKRKLFDREIGELEMREEYAKAKALFPRYFKWSKKADEKLKCTKVVDTDPMDDGKQIEFDYPSEVEKEISIKVEMIRVKKMKEELETDQKVEVAMFEEQQKADERHNKSLESLLAAQFKNIKEIRSPKYMDDTWIKETQDCKSIQEIYDRVKEAALKFSDRDVIQNLSVVKSQMLRKDFKDPDEVISIAKDVWRATRMTHPTRPLSDSTFTDIIHQMNANFRMAMSEVINTDCAHGHHFQTLCQRLIADEEGVYTPDRLSGEYATAKSNYVLERKRAGLDSDSEDEKESSLSKGKKKAMKGLSTNPKSDGPKPSESRKHWCSWHGRYEAEKDCYWRTLCPNTKKGESRQEHAKNCNLRQMCPCRPKSKTNGDEDAGNKSGGFGKNGATKWVDKKRKSDDSQLANLEKQMSKLQQLKEKLLGQSKKKLKSCKTDDEEMEKDEETDDGEDDSPKPPPKREVKFKSIMKRLGITELDSKPDNGNSENNHSDVDQHGDVIMSLGDDENNSEKIKTTADSGAQVRLDLGFHENFHFPKSYSGVQSPDILLQGEIVTAKLAGYTRSGSKNLYAAMDAETLGADTLSAEYFSTEYLSADTLSAEYFSADTLSAEYFSAEYLSADTLSAEYFSAEYLSADTLSAEYFSADTLSAEYLSAEYLSAEYFSADTLSADTLSAECLSAEYLSAEYLSAEYFSADNLSADTLSAECLSAE